MGVTERFREQHRELVECVKKIQSLTSTTNLSSVADEVVMVLADMSGKLNVHLAMEDNSLYPRLLKHEDKNIRDTAGKFVTEMSGIKNAFGSYIKSWRNVKSINESPRDFVKESNKIFEALSKRIIREDNELYNLIDKLG